MPTPERTSTPKRREEEWLRCEADEVADVLVAAMALGGVDHLFFSSGSDIIFFQEACAKAKANGRPTPELVTILHETVALNAAIGYSMVTGRPSATAVHVDVGTLNYGCALHTASLGQYPVLLCSGSPATGYPGAMKGARDHPIYWLQETTDQRTIAAPYAKWMWRLELQQNPGLVISRALQACLAHPQAPAFLTIPREVGMAPVDGGRFPSVEQLGRVTPPAPDPEAIDELAGWLVDARQPMIVTGRSGKDPDSVKELVRVAELVGASVTDNGFRDRLNFPAAHPLLETGSPLSLADVVLVVDRRIPWVPAGDRSGVEEIPDDPIDLPLADPARAPSAGCKVAWLAHEPAVIDVPLLEHAGNLRISADPRLGLAVLADAIEDRLDQGDKQRAAERMAAAQDRAVKLTSRAEQAAHSSRGDRPINPRWLAYHLGRIVDDEAIFLDDALSNASLVRRYYRGRRPNSFFYDGGSGGGFGSGAAIGARLAEPERDVILASGDGFYSYGVPSAALWTAVRSGIPYLAVVFVNARYTTGTDQVSAYYPSSHAAAAGFPGGVFDPPPDFAAEAQAAGAHGESVTDPAEVEHALQRGLDAVRGGQPAVVAVRVA